MRRVLCAPNAFKGTLSAFEAAAAMATGVTAAGAEPLQLPVADGGDGTLGVLLGAAGRDARVDELEVSGPMGAPVAARLGWVGPRDAVVELAEASGLRRVEGGLDPLGASSYGTGELIAAAVQRGAERVVVGVGGSACTDGGAGLLQALGARLTDASGRGLPRGGGALARLEHLELAPALLPLRSCRLEVAVDVRNPLLGPEGAAAVFAPQKGAGPGEVVMLERALARLAEVSERDTGAIGLAARSGTGAAGGCGFALALIGAELLPGAQLVCDRVGLDAAISGAALVITGEGRLDSQTAYGKAPAAVAERARRLGVPCVAVAGEVVTPAPAGFDAVYSLQDLAAGEDPRAGAAGWVARAAERATRERLEPGQ